jgi:hypothetical protein
MWFGDYFQKGLRVTNANIQGASVGIDTPYFSDGEMIIENSFIRARTGINVGTMWSVSGGSSLPAKRTTIRNVRFQALAAVPMTNILMNYDAGDGRNVIQRDEVFVYAYNQVATDNFRVYYTQQAATFIVPQTGSNPNPINPVIGSPLAGLTNLLNWNLFGIAIAGGISPTSATRSGIVGLIQAI